MKQCRRYWRSLAELDPSPELAEEIAREFPNDEWHRLPPATRRQFLRAIGASVALAGLNACRWPEEEIVPFATRPEGRTPGVPERFATSLEVGGVATGLLVTSYDGRPVKADGNPLHPDSLGGLSAAGQASVLELYDPDRSRRLVERGPTGEATRDWQAFIDAARPRLAGSGEGVVVLAEASSSPTLAALRERLLELLPRAAWVEYEPVSRDAERLGAILAYGRPLRRLPRLERARVVASLDGDPLVEHPAALRLARDLAATRSAGTGRRSRLWAVESALGLTGAMADHRLALPSSQTPLALVELARVLVAEHGLALPAPLRALVETLAEPASRFDERGLLAALARDLAENRGAGLLLVGPRQPAEVHALAAAIDDALGNVGATVGLVAAPEGDRPAGLEALAALAGRLEAGEVETLLVLGGNPVYAAPPDLGLGELVGRVPFSAHLSQYDDETSRTTLWHIPRAHPFEAWGDGRAWDGTLTMRQPLIAPLYDGREASELLAALLGDEAPAGHDLVRETFRRGVSGGDAESAWRRALHDGIVPDTAWSEVRPALDLRVLERAADGLRRLAELGPPTADALELMLAPDRKLHDGRYANNAWLQELPDPMTKITWDNALLLSPVTATELGVADGEVVEVAAGEARVELPVYLVPGQARLTASASLGYGRRAAGRVGDGVGVDVGPLRSSAAPHLVRGATIRPTGRRYRLATTQDHHVIDRRGFAARNLRVGELVREVSLGELVAHPEAFHAEEGHVPLVSLWREHVYEGEQWGMAIDLDACIGCNACVVACQAENNVPVVGREQVLNQREMHWIRVDRYFASEPGVAPEAVEEAEVRFQPVACVQCENAPCEQVCPVAATQHTSDGLNAMVYNRCIGTRYCSNNCPFKVRRFNFFDYHRGSPEVAELGRNPEVTVRSRGVMEKCTFCVQRIERVRIVAGNEGRSIADGEIVPACAETCPTRAIVFGDLNDPSSEVARLREDDRSYTILAELNVRPRIHYLARVTNPAQGLEAAGEAPQGDHDDHDDGGRETA